MYWYLEVLRKYAVFTGRARRMEYWMFHLVNAVVSLVFVAGLLLSMLLFNPATERIGKTVALSLLLVFCVYALIMLVPSLAVSVRRLHDVNFSGLWLLIALVPMGGTVLLVFHVLDSTPGPNQYGPNPKGVDATVTAIPYPAYGAQTIPTMGAGSPLPNDQGLLVYCTGCGSQMHGGTRFCPHCGKAAY